MILAAYDCDYLVYLERCNIFYMTDEQTQVSSLLTLRSNVYFLLQCRQLVLELAVAQGLV